MDSGSIDRFRLPPGEEPTPDHMRALARHVERNGQLRPGRGILQKQFPWGVSNSFRSYPGGGAVSPYFKPSVTSGDQPRSWNISWAEGYFSDPAGTKEPTINGIPISGDDAGVIPTFNVTLADLNADGEIAIYFKLQWDSAWNWLTIEPTANVTLDSNGNSPVPAPFTAWRLAAKLNDSGALIFRPLVTNVGHLALYPNAQGYALHQFWMLTP